MKTKIFPKVFIETSIEKYLFQIRPVSKAVYLTILISLLMFLISLPFIRIGVTKSLNGQITSTQPSYSVYTPLNGILKQVKIAENMLIKTGDTILVFEDFVVKKELDQLYIRKGEIIELMFDLSKLCGSFIPEDIFKSDRYRLEHEAYKNNLLKLHVALGIAEKTLNRQKILFESGAIAEKEFELDEFKYKQALTELDFFVAQRKTEWKQKLLDFEREIFTIENRTNQLLEEQNKYIVVSPLNGTIQNIFPVERGQVLQAGIKLAEISPSDTLIAISLVHPKDIGLLGVGQHVTFRLDAYNYNDWGMLYGNIYEISNDAYSSDSNAPYFIVRCRISQNYLELKNGFQGKVKKGMTFTANYQVAERSLYQLLYDKVDNWINPQIFAGE